MKTSVVKRVVALTLAALIILGTLGYFFSVVGFAATTSGIKDINYSLSARPLKNGNKATVTVTFKTDDTTLQGKLDAADNNAALTGSTFDVTGNDAVGKCKLTGSKGDYTVVQENAKYSGKGKTFEIEITDKSGNSVAAVSVTMADGDVTEDATTGDDNKPDDGDDDNPAPSLPSNMTYTIKKIYRSNNSVTYDPSDSTKNDPTINRGHYVDAQVQFSIPGVAKEDVVADGSSKIKVLVDRGGFRFQSNTESAIHIDRVLPADGGVICYVSLKGLYYTGSGSTLAFTVESKDSEAEPFIFNQFSAEVSSCVPYTSSPSTDEDDDPDYSKMEMATPYVIVSNYSYGGQVTAGDTFPLSLTFFNTSRNIDVMNMMITITMPDAFMLTSSSNTFYVDQLDTEQSVTQTVQVTAKANAAPQSHNIEVSMKYQYIDDHLVSRRDNSTQETISIPVVQIDRFQVTGVEVSQEIYLNEESYLTVNFVNKGRSDVYNLSAEISGNIQNPGQQQNLGNLSSGSTGTADFYITPDGEGVCSGEVTITYEDTNMEEKTATIQWSTNAVDPMAGMDFNPGMDMPGMMEDPGMMEEETKSPTPFIIGGVVLAAAVAAFLIRRKILKKRSEEADAAL